MAMNQRSVNEARAKARAMAIRERRVVVLCGLDSGDCDRVLVPVEPAYFETGECEAFNGRPDAAYLPDGTEVCPYEEGIL